MKKERIDQLKSYFDKEMKEIAKSHPDIEILINDYESLKSNGKHSTEFLEGYMACISDLSIIKKLM